MEQSRATFKEALTKVIFFSKWSKNYWKCAKGSSLQLCGCKTLQTFVPFVRICFL